MRGTCPKSKHSCLNEQAEDEMTAVVDRLQTVYGQECNKCEQTATRIKKLLYTHFTGSGSLWRLYFISVVQAILQATLGFPADTKPLAIYRF